MLLLKDYYKTYSNKNNTLIINFIFENDSRNKIKSTKKIK